MSVTTCEYTKAQALRTSLSKNINSCQIAFYICWLNLTNQNIYLVRCTQMQIECALSVNTSFECLGLNVKKCRRYDTSTCMYRLNPPSSCVTGYNWGGHSYHPRAEGWKMVYLATLSQGIGLACFCKLISVRGVSTLHLKLAAICHCGNAVTFFATCRGTDKETNCHHRSTSDVFSFLRSPICALVFLGIQQQSKCILSGLNVH